MHWLIISYTFKGKKDISCKNFIKTKKTVYKLQLSLLSELELKKKE